MFEYGHVLFPTVLVFHRYYDTAICQGGCVLIAVIWKVDRRRFECRQEPVRPADWIEMSQRAHAHRAAARHSPPVNNP